jgi:hypothetical protein
MNIKSNQPRVDEIIGFLHDVASQKIQELEAKYPQDAKLFKKGIELGDADKSAENELDIRADICLKGLEAVNSKCSELIPQIKKRLSKIGKLQLANQIIVALGGASILTLLQSDGYLSLKYIGAVLVLIGSLLNIYFLHLSNTITPEGNSIFKTFDLVVSNNFDAQKIHQELTILNQVSHKTEKNVEEIKKNIERGNEICFELKKILIKL